MRTQNTHSYDWLPLELQITGYDYETYETQLSWLTSILSNSDINWRNEQVAKFKREIHNDSRRFYSGAPEILGLLDKENWPPEKSEDFLIWDPENLDGKTRDLMNLHMGIIGAYLFGRLSAPIDLFNLYWRNVITDYVQQLGEVPDTLSIPVEFSQPHRNSLIPKETIYPPCSVQETEDQKKKDDEIIASLSPNTRETFTDLIRDLGTGKCNYQAFYDDNEMRRNGSSSELKFISKQSDHPFLRYRFNGNMERLSDESKGRSYQGISLVSG